MKKDNKRRKIRNRIWLAVCVICVCVLFGFKSNIMLSSVEDQENTEKVKVAFSMAEGTNPWVTNLLSDLTQCADTLGMELIYHEPESVTAEWQKEDLKKLLCEEIDYLAIYPRDDSVLSGILEEAANINLPVIVISKDSSLREKCAAVISVDYEAEGRVSAQILADVFAGEEANIVVIQGPERSTVAMERVRGFMDELKNYSNLHILEFGNGEFDRLTAKYVMEEMISKYGSGKIQAVFASSDEEGMGALQALKITDYLTKNDVKIVSVNGNQDSLKAIVAGEYTASVESSVRMGNVVFELIQRLERGFDKSKYIVIPYQVYDSQNAEKYLSSLY